jgi:hypothetical protein
MRNGIEHLPHTRQDTHSAINACRLKLPRFKGVFVCLLVGVDLNRFGESIVLILERLPLKQ